MPATACVPTRLLILSDTHSASALPSSAAPSRSSPPFPPGYRLPLPSADVVVHCGDLTRHGTSAELRQAFALLRSLDAPLKLVIAGNHDMGLASVRRVVEEAISEERHDGVHYLLEGTHEFTLANGARLRVYASPWTPAYGSWAFQYPRGQHTFSIPRDVDVVMTHGPPRGILDGAGPRRSTGMKIEAAGCDDLFRAVSAAKPMIHCFGHIHEGWGSYLATWKPSAGDEGDDGTVNCRTLVDEAKSRPTCLRDLDPASSFQEGDGQALLQKLARFSQEGGVHVDIAEGEDRVKAGEQTLFLNAAIMSMRYQPTQLPWIVDMRLRRP